jgi:polyhydroxybutyrate depolymerase
MMSLRALRAALILGTVTTGAALASMDARPPLRPGTHKVLVDQRVSGIRRSYYVHVPAGDDGATSLPVVIALHGAFSTARKFERDSGFSVLADRQRFLVVYPQGIGLGNWFRHWNSGHCCGKARKLNLDDVGFALAAVDDVARRNPVDRSRLYAVGFSNGGMLAYRIAAEHPDVVAAAAVVSGTIGGVPAANEPEWSVPRPKQPVPILVLHGRDDTHIPYEGGRAAQSRGKSSSISVSRSMGFWVEADGCDPQPQMESLDDARVEQQTWFGCHHGAEVILDSLNGWGHEWPKANALGGFEAAATIWQFFARHRIAP